MANVVFLSKTLLTGGSAPALDSIDGAGLVDGDFAYVTVAGVLYVYKLDADSAAAESSPTIISPDTNAGDKRWILQGNRNIAVGSDADGDTYYRTAGVLARLAKGAANLKLFMNAGATAPEWAAGIKYVTFNRDIATATGTQAVTGVGFKPSAVLFFVSVYGTNKMSLGFNDTAGYAEIHDVTGGNYENAATRAIMLWEASPDYYSGAVSSWDADGFTVSWTKTGSPTGTANIYALCIR